MSGKELSINSLDKEKDSMAPEESKGKKLDQEFTEPEKNEEGVDVDEKGTKQEQLPTEVSKNG